MTWTIHTLTLSNLWFDGHVFITYEIVQILCALSMLQRCILRSNYVRIKLPNGQWKWKFQLFFSNLFTDFLMFSIFWIYLFLIDGFRQETYRKLMKRITDALVHGQYFLTQECDYNFWVLQFLNIGAELPACLIKESPQFDKNCSSYLSERSWLDIAMSLAWKT